MILGGVAILKNGILPERSNHYGDVAENKFNE